MGVSQGLFGFISVLVGNCKVFSQIFHTEEVALFLPSPCSSPVLMQRLGSGSEQMPPEARIEQTFSWPSVAAVGGT